MLNFVSDTSDKLLLNVTDNLLMSLDIILQHQYYFSVCFACFF